MAVEVKSEGTPTTEAAAAPPKQELTAGEPGTASEESCAAPAVDKSASFKEESNFLSDLKDSERKALLELRATVEAAILENPLFRKQHQQKEHKPPENDEEQEAQDEPAKPEPSEEEEEEEEDKPESKEGDAEKTKPEGDEAALAEEKPSEASLWGVPLLPSKGDESTDVVLLKFLRARDFKVKDAHEMLEKTLQWRKDWQINTILEDDALGADLGAACFMDGIDLEGHPVCYNVPGVFDAAELYQKAFGMEEGREKFLRWRVQVMEMGIKQLDFKPGGVSSLLQITDLKDSPGPWKKEMRTAMRLGVELLQDNYPELVARNIIINVPFWYYAFSAILSPFLTQRTKSKFVVARPAKATETLLKYIPVDAIPVKYGGLKRENDIEFSEDSRVSELIVKANSTETVEIPAPEIGTTLIWELTVLGWEVNYKEEFVPSDEGSYTIIIKKGRKMGAQEEAVRNSFKNNENGKVVLTIENGGFRRKKAFFRYKTTNSS